MTGIDPPPLVVVDTNIVDEPDIEFLRSLSAAGSIRLARTDTVDTELALKSDAEELERLTSQSAQLEEVAGPLVLGHSRLGIAHLGATTETDLLGEVNALLWGPGTDADPDSHRSRRRFRDAMHIATSIGAGADLFVTHDGLNGADRSLLGRAAAIQERFGLQVVSLARAVEMFTDE